ncbi:MAG: hypothetical protein U0136_13290 [Bdellovibrionota bacterium]
MSSISLGRSNPPKMQPSNQAPSPSDGVSPKLPLPLEDPVQRALQDLHKKFAPLRMPAKPPVERTEAESSALRAGQGSFGAPTPFFTP